MRRIVLLVLLGIALSGCADTAASFSDLVPASRDYGETIKMCERSLDAELTPESTIEDAKAWFARHHVPLKKIYDSPSGNHETIVSGRFAWGAEAIYVDLWFNRQGKLCRARFITRSRRCRTRGIGLACC